MSRMVSNNIIFIYGRPTSVTQKLGSNYELYEKAMIFIKKKNRGLTMHEIDLYTNIYGK